MMKQQSLGQIMANQLTLFLGSWPFVLFQLFMVLAWCLLNVFLVATDRGDISLYIFLILTLVIIASLSVPIILMELRLQSERNQALHTRNLHVESMIADMREAILTRQEEMQSLLIDMHVLVNEMHAMTHAAQERSQKRGRRKTEADMETVPPA